ncbi:MAG: hypothetical protein WAW36_10730 [Methylovulum miyakonense]|uniref:hypothetical protein n=1 Tax=Methylovulum miyakonense TaxID=645578 RepID=UPI003BB4996E
MHKIAVVVLADTTQTDSMGRIVNALMAAKELKENLDDVQLIFTGTGTKWLPELTRPEHELHGLFNEVKASIRGACGFCATAYDVKQPIIACGVPILEEYGTNMSFLNLLNDGYQIITF